MTTSKAKLLGLALIAALVFGTTAPAWAGWDEGLAAYDRGDYATALREWRPLAEQGHADAQNSLGFMYSSGHGVPWDYKAAAKWFRKAAEQGNVVAQSMLGFMYVLGQGLPQSFAEARRWLRKAADQGDADAQSMLDDLER